MSSILFRGAVIRYADLRFEAEGVPFRYPTNGGMEAQ